MATNTYITLANSNASVSKKFRVVMGSLLPKINKVQTRRRTLTGRMDSQHGQPWRSWAMTLRVKAASDISGYGLLSDLETLFSYNNPAATPSTTISFTNHTGTTYSVELLGDISEENLTPYLDGSDAAYLIPIQMEETL